MAKKKKYYVVWAGLEPGIYTSWAACQKQIQGYPAAKYKSFKSEEAAKAAYYNGTAAEYIGTVKKASKTNPATSLNEFKNDIVWDSISVDAACAGNPGVMEYQGVDTKTGYQYFHQKFNLGTNNIGEFLAIVHALAIFQKENKKTSIYTDSKIAMGWIKAKKCRTKLVRNIKTAALYQVIERAEGWLKNNSFENPILKWETKLWGEIPADFGRK
jgi:ribonuclease HI